MWNNSGTKLFKDFRRPDTGGAAAVEFGLIAPVLMIMIFGMVDYGLAMVNKMELRGAARVGAQYALGDSSDTAAIIAAVVAASNVGITAADVTLTCNCRDTALEPPSDLTATTCGATTCLSTEPTLMTVNATQDYTLFFGATTLTLVGEATVRIK